MRSRILSIVSCMAIAILLMSNLSTVVIAESDLAISDDVSMGDLTMDDLLWYTGLGAGSLVVGGVVGGFTYMYTYYTLWETRTMMHVISPVGLRSISAVASVFAALGATAAVFGIGYGIYQAVSG